MAASRRSRESSLPDAKPDKAVRRQKVLAWVIIGLLLFSTLVVLAQVFADG